MSTIEFGITLLVDPTSSKDGNFIIACMELNWAFALYGPNSPNTAGTKVDFKTLAECQSRLADQRRANYSDAKPHEVSKAALDNLVSMIRDKVANLPAQVRIESTRIVFGDAAAPQKPRRSKTDVTNYWFKCA